MLLQEKEGVVEVVAKVVGEAVVEEGQVGLVVVEMCVV
jgi:hypothetical protein